MSQCSMCESKFTLKKNLYCHMRKYHDIEPKLPGKLICPLSCVEKFRTHNDLRSHLESFHQQSIEYEEHEFPDNEAFEGWKKRLEATSGYSYIRRITRKTLSTGEEKSHYICHRSGVFKSASKGHRKPRKMGSNKIGSTCPAVIEVARSLAHGRVSVIYFKTHIGHEADVVRASLHRSFRPKVTATLPYDVCVVLPAAGSGERMGVATPKQYIPVHKKPLICYTVEAFLKISFVKKVVVVAAPENLDLMLQTLTQMCTLMDEKLMVTEGGSFRHQSIDSGLKALQMCSDLTPEVVVIHDGVRPFITDDIVHDVVTAAKEHGAAGVMCPLVSTVISANKNGFLDSSLDRNKYKASEMPQAFQFDVICKAYAECSAWDLEYGTECLQLVQKYASIQPKLLPGTSNLWKVTHPKDIYTAAALVKENQSVGIAVNKPLPPLLPFLKNSLNSKFKSVHLGRNKEPVFGKHPNIVMIHTNKSPYDIIEQMKLFSVGPKLTQLTTVVNILQRGFDQNINFLELHKQAKACAKQLAEANMVVYYVMWEPTEAAETFEEKAELVTSLLFDSNPCISGTVFIS